MPSDQLLLGVDVGTTQTKVSAFTVDGRQLSFASERYPAEPGRGPDAREQDPKDWWAATIRGLKRALADIDPGRLLALSVGGQGPTVVGMDAALEPVGPALTWMDNRATEEWKRLNGRLPTPLPRHAYVPKVMWLKSHRPGAYAAAQFYCQAWDFVAAQLSGQAVVSMSPSIAPWSDALIEAAELDDAKFPSLRTMGSPIGRVTPQAARLTGLPDGLPIIGGISDYFEGLIGSGTLAPGLACDNGGTSQSFNLCWDAELEADGVFCLPSFDDNYWYVGGPAATTGKALEWWSEQILLTETAESKLMQEVESIPSGSDGLIFLPYLAGERAPIWDPNARGAFFGLSLKHGRAHLTRAILESVGFILYHLIERIEAGGGRVAEIRACGGQARSQLWCQIKADVTGRPIVVPEVTEAAVLGASIIAGLGAGVFNSYSEGAEQMVRFRSTVEPDAARNERYQTLFPIFRDLYPTLQTMYQRLEGVTT